MLPSYWLKHANLPGHWWLKVTADNWQDSENCETDCDHSPKDHTEKLVQEDKVGGPLGHKASVRVADEDPSEDEAPYEGVDVAAGDEGCSDVEDWTGDKSVAWSLKRIGHQDTNAVNWTKDAWGRQQMY